MTSGGVVSGTPCCEAYPMTVPDTADHDVRLPALRAGWWLGWGSVAAVLGALTLGLPARHPDELLILILVAAAANAMLMVVPWQRWLTAGRGQAMLDLWSGGLLALATLVVALGGATSHLDLLLFLITPFLATVHQARRRVAWLALAALAFASTVVLAPLAAGDVFLRLTLLASTTLLAVVLARLTAREAAARAEADAHSHLTRALVADAHHRVKNSLQIVADVLLLNRPDGPDGRRFDETAERIRAIAAVHRLLAGGHDAVDAHSVLDAVAQAAGVRPSLDIDPLTLDAARAQHLGIVANELITNAARHGRPPIAVHLRRGKEIVLRVTDSGSGPGGHPPRLGLQLVRQVAEQGLHGTLTLEGRPDGGWAEVRYPAAAS